jgi:hypothetical protein
MSTRAERNRRQTKGRKGAFKDTAAQEALDQEANIKLANAGASPTDIEIVSTTQKILRTDPDDQSQISSILASVSPGVRTGVIKHFRTNEKLRELFPEYTIFFDDGEFESQSDVSLPLA